MSGAPSLAPDFDPLAAPAFDFAQWHADNIIRREALRAAVRAHLGAGGLVTESWQAASGPRVVAWSCGSGRFVAPYDTDPIYLADHLISRHMGFGWDLVVGETLYRFGRPV